ncbi:MAG: hypothetical protein AAGL23_00890 [Pseudomonadota bacterium]
MKLVDILKEFELDVLQRLGGRTFSSRQFSKITREAEFVSLDFTGAGYFLTFRHDSLSEQRVVLNDPVVLGRIGEMTVGFVAFIEYRELTLECHSFGDEVFPDSFRELDVEVSTQSTTK